MNNIANFVSVFPLEVCIARLHAWQRAGAPLTLDQAADGWHFTFHALMVGRLPRFRIEGRLSAHDGATRVTLRFLPTLTDRVIFLLCMSPTIIVMWLAGRWIGGIVRGVPLYGFDPLVMGVLLALCVIGGIAAVVLVLLPAHHLQRTISQVLTRENSDLSLAGF